MAGSETVTIDRDELEESSDDHKPLGVTGEKIYCLKMSILQLVQLVSIAEMVRL